MLNFADDQIDIRPASTSQQVQEIINFGNETSKKKKNIKAKIRIKEDRATNRHK